MKDMVSFGCHD
jgi:hypothetical protein